MNKKTTPWIFVTLLGFMLLLLFLLIFANYKYKLQIPLALYFFLLVICDLAATAFLTGALKSAASYEGPLFKGNLKLAGPAVIFFLILIVGYRFRPTDSAPPFNLAINLVTPAGGHDNIRGEVSLMMDANIINGDIKDGGHVLFPNLGQEYAGSDVHLKSNIEGYKLSEKDDTTVTLSKYGNQGIYIKLVPKTDSTLYTGYISKKRAPVPYATVKFPEYLKTVQTDREGMFRVYLVARPGSQTDVMVFDSGTAAPYTGRVYLGNTIKIPIDD